jgi:hypothetical protein
MPPSSLPQQEPQHSNIGEVSVTSIKESEAQDVRELASLLSGDSRTLDDAVTTFEVQLKNVLKTGPVTSKKKISRDSFFQQVANRGTLRGGRGGRGAGAKSRSLPPSPSSQQEQEPQHEVSAAFVREGEAPGVVVDTAAVLASESDISGSEAGAGEAAESTTGTEAATAEVRWDKIRKNLPAVSKKTIHRDAFIALLLEKRSLKKPAKHLVPGLEEPSIGSNNNADGATTDHRSEGIFTAAGLNREPSSPVREESTSSEVPKSRVGRILKRKSSSKTNLVPRGDVATPAVEPAMVISNTSAGVAETKSNDNGTDNISTDITSVPFTSKVDKILSATSEI